MNLIKHNYLKGFVKNLHTKLIHFSIIYKILVIFNYNFFFYFKSILLTNFFYRLYLLNTNFYFLFTDYIYLINYFEYLTKHNSGLFVMPVKIKSYSVLRSPFVYSKSRENFSIHYYSLFFNIKPWKISKIYFLFLNKLLYNIKLDSSKFWYKRVISF